MNIYCHFKFHDWSWVSLEHGLHQKFNFLLLVLHSCWERWPSTPLPTFKFFSRYIYERGVYGIRCVSLLCVLSTPQTILGTKLDCIRNFLIIYQLWIAYIINSNFGNKVEYHLINDLTKSLFFSPLLPSNGVERDFPLNPFPPSQIEIEWKKRLRSKIRGPIMGASNSTSNLGPLDLIGS